jgi:hypothetical protein
MKTRKIEDKLADPTLEIGADNIAFNRAMIASFKAYIAFFQAKADVATSPQQRGGYKSHQNRSVLNLQKAENNLAFQLDWLRRHRPAIYDEVK